MAQVSQLEIAYTPVKPPLPPSALKRIQTLKDARRIAPVVQEVDIIDADTLTSENLSLPFPPSSPRSAGLECGLAPPVPPPPPPPLSLASHASFPGRSAADPCVPREVVEAWDRLFTEGIEGDVAITTEDGGVFAAHSYVLAASSPVWQALFERKACGSWSHAIVIPGVSYPAARAFVRFIYSSRYEREEMQKYVLHFLVLAHAYCIPALKRVCQQQLEQGLLSTDNAIDVMKLARLCDAPRLNLTSMRFIIRNFKLVVRSEGWRAMREYEPSLEQELVEAVIEADSKRQERIRKAEEEKVYGQLHDAMQALVHICRDGCRSISPSDKTVDGRKQLPCKFPACKGGLISLVRHFAGCKLKVSGGCVHCKRMWQLLELHSRMCPDTTTCKVPLCSHFKDRIVSLQQSARDETRWKTLVSKVLQAKGVATSFSLAAVSARLERLA